MTPAPEPPGRSPESLRRFLQLRRELSDDLRQQPTPSARARATGLRDPGAGPFLALVVLCVVVFASAVGIVVLLFWWVGII